MSFKNMDKLIYPAGYFRLRYSLNCVETHRGVFTVTEFNFRQRGVFFPCGLIKASSLQLSLWDDTLMFHIVLYVTLFSILSLFFSLFPWILSSSLPHIHSLFLICLFPVHLLFISHVVHHLFPLSYPLLFSLYSVMYTCSSLQTS